MAEEELRSRNRDLISRLYASQRFVRQSTESVKTLVRGLDDLQVNIDRVKNFNSRDLGYDGGGDPFLPSQSRSSLDISAANVNNNNMTQLRRTCLWPEEKLAMDSSYQLQRADSPQLQETVSPQLQKTASPQFKDSGVLKDKLNDLQVVKTSPETSREIRRKLAEEMVCEESCPSLNDTIGDLDPPRASFKNVTNTTHAPPAADNIIHTPSAAKSTKSVYETPKSILKHRRLIDSNVQVESKFVHTPGWMDRAKLRISA
ncbi:hypothetical protein EB796_007574 [Bugula neritina]|uniref:Uncharacterized protein n=1 Tax=Bugula neritina TaxID=10212 RepID=A0A7J7K673_BUGNE|nr:hypothetical protein EB796_007574 [Bugula neritina]